jgi:hypothetical protein
MPRNAVSIEIDASAEAVFDVIHDYGCRLEWDSMLSRACLLGGATAAGVGVRSLCVGTWQGGFLALQTEYIRFDRGRAAAVKLTNRPAFFRSFAATITHSPVDGGRSRTTYIYSFRARPRFLVSLLEPIMSALIAREVRARLRALRRFVELSARRR